MIRILFWVVSYVSYTYFKSGIIKYVACIFKKVPYFSNYGFHNFIINEFTSKVLDRTYSYTSLNCVIVWNAVIINQKLTVTIILIVPILVENN